MAEDSPSLDQIKQFETRLDYLEYVAREAVGRLYTIEQHLGIAFQASPFEPEMPPQLVRDAQKDASVETPQPGSPVLKSALEPAQPELPEATANEIDQRTLVASKSTDAEPQRATPPSSHQPAEVGVPATPARHLGILDVPVPAGPSTVSGAFSRPSDLESRIGGSWFNRIGIIAIFLGVTFFLKYAVDNQWVGPAGRVLIGAAVGVAFLVVGERLRKRYPSYAYGLTGGGIAVLYAAIWFASGNKYGLLSQPVAFALMAVVTATASLLSARYNALPIAVLGLVGGFLTPILLSTGVDNQVGLFTYIVLLDLGVLALAYSKQWRSLNYMAFISTVLMFAAWMSAWYSVEKLGTTIFFLTLLFAIFALLAVLYNVINRRPTRWLDLAMVFSNALLYFGATYDLLDDNYRSVLGLFALLVSVFYAGLGYFSYNRHREDRLLIFTFVGLAFLFAVLAVPIQFDQHWVTMGWAIEGAVMSWVGLRANDRTSRYSALVVFGVAVAHWFNIDMQEFGYLANESFLPLLNRRALSSAVIVAALAATVALYRRTKSDVKDEERSMFIGLYLLASNAMAVILLSLEANDYFSGQKAGTQQAGTEGDRLDNSRYFTISTLWSIYGAAALIVGIKQRLKLLRVAALVLLAAAIVLVLIQNLSYYAAPWHTLGFNQTFGSFALLIGALASGAWFYANAKEIGDDERKIVLFGLIGAANVLAVIALSAEALGYFDRSQTLAGGAIAAQLENTKQLALSAVWTIYGATALLIGLLRREKLVRIGALMLLALATFKVAFVDLRYFDAGWHSLLLNPTFAAFALLIVAFAVCIWVYARSEDIRDYERGVVIPVLVGVANVLAVVALSAEAIGYFHRTRALIDSELVDEISRLANNEQFVLSALWSIYGASVIVFAATRGRRYLRWGALFLLAIATTKVFLWDTPFYDAAWHTLIFNQTFGAFAFLIGALSCAVWAYSWGKKISAKERTNLIPVLVTSANLLAIISLSLEALGHYAVQLRIGGLTTEQIANLRLAQQLSLSVVWAIYGGVMLTVGIARRSKLLRVMALLLLGLTIFKAFLFDLASLERLYRIISFIVLGAILLAVSFLYQRYRQRVAAFIGDNEAAAPANTE